MNAFAEVLDTLPAVLRPALAASWQDYCDACAREELPAWPVERLHELAMVWAASEFVAAACVRRPAMLHELLTGGDLDHAYAPGQLRQRVDAALLDVSSEDALGVALRRLRQREMVRIAWRDLGGLAPTAATLGDLTDLADACVDAALGQLHVWEVARHGEPRDEHGQAQRLVVLGMGKLGGRELNYSSDIDLIFAFPEHGETDGRRSVSNQEFFLRLGQRLIRALDALTAEGFVFRVDMRLRPFGDSGPLVASFGAFETYYQTQGREWERYALIKARAIAGDIAAGEQLLATLAPFVYRRYLDFGAFEALRKLKAMIAAEVERKGMQDNVKLGRGGIREIEFIGQAFQLIYGGREPELRVRGILAVLERLALTRRLPEDAVVHLQYAYDFLRRTENRIQAQRDQQTHALPADELARTRLALAMGFADWGRFRDTLDGHRDYVAGQFHAVFSEPEAVTAAGEEVVDLGTVWAGQAGELAAVEALRGAGFDDAPQALAALERLRGSFSCRAMREQGRERLDRLMPRLLTALGKVEQPSRTLDRLLPLLEAIARRSVYLALLFESPVALDQLVTLASASPRITEQLTRFPVLLDELLNPAALYAPPNAAALRAELERMLSRVAADDFESQLITLRQFKQINVLRVAAADISGALPLMVVSDHLTMIAERLLARALELAWADTVARHGHPRCRVDGVERTAGFAIIAYGKLGGIELGYGSDLDLVFLHDSSGEEQQTDGARVLDNPSFFARLGQRLIHILSAPTPAGILYEVDTRLRPSGRAGMLVANVEAFADYQRRDAWTWEHQALVRARPVAGDAAIGARFIAIRQEILARPRDPLELRREVREMRERMRSEHGSRRADEFHLKQDRGGMADIEFIVQYLLLAHSREEPILARFTDNVRQLAALEATGILSSSDANLLRDAYRRLRRRSHIAKLRDEPSVIHGDELKEYREGAAALWRRLMED
ncbi:bifunctional [glutamate--ammonia ligase]-adenylyl-L-tyrosine phosphorylase/[glutamate--ammonia-ligase] adenylyltransferase [Plasticicumulans acidivorans]|uniref:Bifunctional glutamine synthetase adenylyltransferase/adenylyl-removing enzyme n=1 Tax=Plasticicumulans acidivorans TaxID=886464 RepID=A0A317MW53_9GAMM|nr:bifunctional [glutamate--ammonia ligase]-adenylyl-L-tyrosine phosphorylase/[glutamate--ammonia-ligase] adenylyltransferase [Plasticicumulans acidivorans]PWV62507.1 glutamate-ammonia-ligase adenylyltransferase [Plasticicumulans acidivorans]